MFDFTGPSFWGLINPQWNMCNKGRRQSPIDVVPDKLLFDPYLRQLHIDKHKVNHTVPPTFLPPFTPITSTDLTDSPFLFSFLSPSWWGHHWQPSTGFRHASQHWSITCLSRGQGHKAAREHIRRSLGLSLPVRRDLHTLRYRE